MNTIEQTRDEFLTVERITKKRDRPGGAGVHYHNGFEVYYLIEGTCWYFIDKKSYHLTAGDIALIPRGVLHKTAYETDVYTRLLVYCDESFIPPSVLEVVCAIGYFAHADEHAAEVARLFSEIEREWDSSDEFSRDVIRGRLYELFVLIARRSRALPVKKEESPIVECAVRYIREHYAEEISLSDVAAVCYTSREHLSRTFKRETGFGFCEYLTAYRLKRAESLLKSNPCCRIGAVAAACGFSDSNYFSKVYRKVYNKSPTQEKRSR